MALIDFAPAWLHRDEEGQGLAEYALILALIAIVAIVALLFLGGQDQHGAQHRRGLALTADPATGAGAHHWIAQVLDRAGRVHSLPDA